MLSRKRCRGTLQDYNKGEFSKCQSKLWTNRNVFSWCLNGTREETVWRDDGRLFHARGAATGKARSPKVDLCTGETTSVVVVDDRRSRRLSMSTVAWKMLLIHTLGRQQVVSTRRMEPRQKKRTPWVMSVLILGMMSNWGWWLECPCRCLCLQQVVKVSRCWMWWEFPSQFFSLLMLNVLWHRVVMITLFE